LTKKKIYKDLNSLLKSRFEDDLKDIVLFGSHAYGNTHKDPDYGSLIILKKRLTGKLRERFQIYVLRWN